MKLKELLTGISVLECTADPELEIKEIFYDSRKATPGSLFVAVSGFAADGNKFIPMAAEKGAAAVVTAKKPEEDIPYVLVNRYLEKDEDTYVVLDDYQAAYMTAKHLCSYGNEKIFFLNFLPSVSSAQNRLEGYKKALEDCGIPYEPNMVVSGCTDQADGYESMKRILERNKPPLSVMCYSDYIAIGAICAIQERGFNLPHDIALSGNDDIGILSFVKPRLTTIGSPKLRMGIESARLLIELMDARAKMEDEEEETEPEEKKHVVMKPELILRETS